MLGRPSVPSVSVREAHDRLSGGDGPRPILVDVRTPEEFVQVRVPGAVHIPLQEFVHRMGELPQDRPLLLFCRSGGRSGSATAFLLRNGYADVANIDGGILAWYQAGLPVRTGRPEPGEGEAEAIPG